MKFLRRPEVCKRTGLSYPTIWRQERAGAFPARRSLGPNSVGWLEHEIDMWIESRVRRPVKAEKPREESPPLGALALTEDEATQFEEWTTEAGKPTKLMEQAAELHKNWQSKLKP